MSFPVWTEPAHDVGGPRLPDGAGRQDADKLGRDDIRAEALPHAGLRHSAHRHPAGRITHLQKRLSPCVDSTQRQQHTGVRLSCLVHLCIGSALSCL